MSSVQSIRIALLTGCTSLAMGVAGCDPAIVHESDERRNPERASPAPESAATKSELNERGSLSDSRIQTAVIHRLFSEGVIVPGTKISVDVADGIVKLHGETRSLYEKRRAEDVVQTTKGVLGLVDQLEVAVSNVSDQDLVTLVNDALLFDSATEAYEVAVQAKDGVVSLSGSVDSFAERGLVSQVASSVQGVRGVKNNLQVSAPVVRPAAEIERDIVGRLRNDVLVDANSLRVKADGGQVILSGVVGSLAEKKRAMSRSWVAGVSQVDGSDVSVQWWERGRFERQNTPTIRPDVEIKRAVESALRFEERVDSSQIESYVDRSRVTLVGSVSSLQEKELASATVRDTLGVDRVRNYLSVSPRDEIDDERLKARVERSLKFNPYLINWKGQVRVDNRKVTLLGSVTTAEQRRQAEYAASRILGVTHVENELDIFLDEIEDRALKDDVEEQLFWNVFVDSNNVNVSADRGMVTLTGRVRDLRAYRSASNAARRAGAEVVINKLELPTAGG